MRKRRTKQQIYLILREYQSSQLSQREFCDKNNIKLNTFQTWIGRYKKERDFPLNPDVKGEVASNFLEIKPEKMDVSQQQITITYASQKFYYKTVFCNCTNKGEIGAYSPTNKDAYGNRLPNPFTQLAFFLGTVVSLCAYSVISH